MFLLSMFMHSSIPKRIPINNLGLVFHIFPNNIPIKDRWESRDFTIN